MRFANFLVDTILSATLSLSLPAISMAEESPATSSVLFILDGSGSMWGRVNEVEKIVVAKDVMTNLIHGLPETIKPGLISYGHRKKGVCSDIETIARPGAASRPALVKALADINPRGKTPIADSLLQAGDILRDTEEASSVVLVSDGIESCEGDPCAVAKSLRDQGINVAIHVVGFDVDAEAREQLSCIAENGGGEYYQAGSAGALSAALAAVRTTIVEPEIVETPETGEGEAVTRQTNVSLADDVLGGVGVVDTETGNEITHLFKTTKSLVPTGSYTLEFDHFTSSPVSIKQEESYVIAAADYGLSILRLDGTLSGGVQVIDVKTGKVLTRLTGNRGVQVPPGPYVFKFASFQSPTVTIEANITHTISPSNYGLAEIALDGTQLGGVQIVDANSGKVIIRLTGKGRKQVPPGSYILKFNNFTSPELVVEPNSRHTISPSDYGLATLTREDSLPGSVDIIDSNTGNKLTGLAKRSSRQIPAGDYTLRYRNEEVGSFTLKENEVRVLDLK